LNFKLFGFPKKIAVWSLKKPPSQPRRYRDGGSRQGVAYHPVVDYSIKWEAPRVKIIFVIFGYLFLAFFAHSRIPSASEKTGKTLHPEEGFCPGPQGGNLTDPPPWR
jgi:hypothetical protein